MTAWSQMSAQQFDRTQVASRAARQVVQTAPETLFPSLLPQPKPKDRGQVTDPLGTGDLLALLEEEQ